jgi:polysaccharide pyruvyl transferase WcaK-like protein
MKKIALWGAWYGGHNVGDQVLLLTITDILAQTLGEVKFTVLTDNPEHVNAYTRQESRHPLDAFHNRKQFFEVVRRVAGADLFIFGGGVPFYEAREHVLAMALLVGIARLARTPYILWTVSSQEVHDPFARRVFGWVLNAADAITYRDPHTHALFQECGARRPMHLAADSGFWLEPAPPEQANEQLERAGLRDRYRPLAALTPRTLRSKDGEAETHYNPKTQAQFEQEIRCFAAALDWLWENGYQPVFVPMNTVAPDDDRIAARRVMECARHGAHALLVDEEIRPRVAPAIYAQCELSFVARVHGSITSLVANCPVMMYAFAPKHAGIMASMGLEPYALPEASATPERTVALLADLLANREPLRRSMAARLEALKQEALLPARMAADLLKSRRGA